MVITVRLHDAKQKMINNAASKLSSEVFVNELVYADDSLLVDVNQEVPQEYIAYVAEAGREYGLSFNWKKLELLPVRASAKIRKPDGTLVKPAESMLYLGSLLAADGKITSELGRRMGMAQNDFAAFEKVWKHSALSRKKKLLIFSSCICLMLAYGIFTAHLTIAEFRRIDGFQTRCLRKILRISHAYYNRISNETVRQIASETRLSKRSSGSKCGT